ncbi:MAG: ECF-type riboflavin transporter substrate-binding protein [Pseudobutyrivibrio sp.]|nr:ECF-type riboflavin transporter substrate-binding protein [Pseudobutyrivibrio sp.]
MKYKFKFGYRELVASILGITLFFGLTTFRVPFEIIPATAIQVRYALLAVLSAIYGPIVGFVIGFFGHMIADLLFYDKLYMAWVIADGVLGLGIGWFYHRYDVLEGEFNIKKAGFFNVVQLMFNALSWIVIAPTLDALVFGEEVLRTYTQGFFAFIVDILTIGILGTAILFAVSSLKKSWLAMENKED